MTRQTLPELGPQAVRPLFAATIIGRKVPLVHRRGHVTRPAEGAGRLSIIAKTLTAYARRSLVQTGSSDERGASMEKIILDCDPGHDDAIAILLAAGNPNIDLLGITTVSGNHNVENTTRNALAVCTAYGIKVPVAKGSPGPIISDQVLAVEIHGETGLDGPVLPPASFDLDKRHAVDFIIDTVMAHEPKTVTLVPVGPYTNIALAIRKEPRIIERVKRVVAMGGSLYARQHHARGGVQRLCRRGGRRCRVPRQLGRHHGGARPHPPGAGHAGAAGQGARRRRPDQPSSSSISGSSSRRRMAASCRSSILPSMTHAASRP